MLVSAPASTSSFTTLYLLRRTASCRAVSPSCEQRHTVEMKEPSSAHGHMEPETAAAHPVFGVDFDATGQEVLYDVDVAGPGGHVQRRAAQLQRCTPADTVTGSYLCHPPLCRAQPRWCVHTSPATNGSHLISGVQVGSVAPQGFDDLQAPPSAGPVEGPGAQLERTEGGRCRSYK